MRLDLRRQCGNDGRVKKMGEGTNTTASGCTGTRVLVLLATALGALLLAGNALAGGPTISSDQADYAPGSTVTLTGSGWGVGETVHVTVDDLLGQTWSWASTPDPIAGLDGSFTVTLDLPNVFVSDYSVKAIGSSGASATTAFTDGDVKSATLAIRKSDCTTAATAFNSGDTVCASSKITEVSGNGSGDIFVQWTKPDGTLATAVQQHTGLVNTSFSDTLAVATSGTWTVTVCSNGSFPCGPNQAKATQTFTVAAPSNTSPDVAANNAAVSANEGSNVTNAGTWSDVDSGDVVTLSASVGTVTKSGTNASGTWSWSLGTGDGPAGPTTVTITANDGHTTRTATFSYSVTNVAPVVSAPADQSATVNASQSFTLGSFGDPGADSPWSVDVDWGDGSAHGSGSVAAAGAIAAQSHTYATAAGSPYTVTVKVTDKDGASGTQTFKVNVSKLSQSITFGAPTGKTYGDGDFDPGATASSGLGVSYSSSTSSVCTIASSKIHIVGAGLCSVTASQAGNGVYAAATDVTQTFTVAQKGVTVTAAAGQSKAYGDVDPALAFTNDAGLGAAAFSGALSRAAGENVGMYAINIGTLSAGTNYILTLASPATFAITQRTLHVAADVQTKTYGDGDSALTYTVTAADLQFGDTAASALSGSLHRAPGESVAGGPYAIDKGTLAANGNYSLAFTGANLTVTARPVTATAEPKSKVYGNDDPALTFKVTNGSLAFSDAFTGSLSRAAGQDVGTYAITQGTLALNANYDLTYVGADLTITKRGVAVAAEPKTKVYGANDPELTYQITSGALAYHDTFSGSLTRAAGESVADGGYAIGRGTLSLGDNYALDFTGSTLTITPRTLKVTADVQSKTYGAADPALTYTVNGLQFDDTAAGVLNGTPAREAGEGVSASPYAITVGSLKANANYTLDFVGSKLTITPRTLEVTADAQSKVYGADDPALSYKVTGLQFTDAAADVLSGALARAAGEGVAGSPYPITVGALKANANYTLDFTGSALTITPRTLHVTADGQSKIYGADDPVFTYSLSGLQFSDTKAGVLTGGLTRESGQAVAGSPYAIKRGSLESNANYTIAFTGADLAITPRTLHVTADAQSKIYGDSDPALTYKVTKADLQYSDTEGVISGKLDRADGESVGSYAIGKGTLVVNSNYELDFSPADLSITPRKLQITANGQAKVYGEDDPALTYEVAGLQFSDAKAEVLKGGLARANGESVAGSPYAITVGTLEANANYTIAFTSADLKITPRTLSVTADPQTKVYGASDPALTYKVAGLQFSDTAEAVLSGKLGRDAGEAVAASPYPITSGTLTANANYKLDFTGSALTVTARKLQVAADAQSKAYGDADPALTYKVTGLQFSDTAAGVLSGSLGRDAGESVTGGPYAITVGSLSANTNYDLVFDGSSLTITPRKLKVTADSQTKAYGAVDPALTYGVTGLQFSEKATDVLTGTLDRANGETVEGSPYAIKVGTLAANSNYTLDFTGSVLNVTPRTLHVKAAAQTKVYGDPDPAFGYSVTQADLQFTDTADGVLSGSLDRSTGETVAGGPYPIKAGTLKSNANYTVDFTGSTLTITPRTLHVTADSQTKVYGAADPALTYGVSGLQFSDTATGALSGKLDRAAGETVAGSPYAINKGTLAANPNYALDFAGSNLTVTPATLQVTADPQTKVYGNADPTFTYGVTGLKLSDTRAGVLTGALARDAGETVVGSPFGIKKGTLAANGNYTIDYTGSNLTITARPITVTANPQTKVIGAADPTLTYKVTGTLVGTDSFSGALSRAPGEAIGTYAINQGTLSLGSNYTLTYVGALLSIQYGWNGFLQPINDTAHQIGASESLFKLGSTVPVKFQLKNASGGIVQASALPQFTRSANRGACDATVAAETPATDPAFTSSTYRWDTNQYIYNFSTKGLSAGEYRIYAVLDDGSANGNWVDICLR
jgi:hypothetical protein